MRDDRYDLDRFVMAQAPMYDLALSELIGGRKVTHWMWFIFPQLRGLGRSSTAQHYGIASPDEAHAYLGHAVLGPRLRECVQAVLDCGETDLNVVFGSPDDMKFRSSMTLFSSVSDEADDIFDAALAKFSDGRKDERTLTLLAS
jgi:uncharacterized protein (DUF1810 family)